MGTSYFSYSRKKTLIHIIVYFALFLVGDLVNSIFFDLLSVVRLPIKALYYIPRTLGCIIWTYFLFWIYTTKVLHLKMSDFGIVPAIKKWGIIYALCLPAFVVACFILIGKVSINRFAYSEMILIVIYSLLTALKAGILEEMLFRGYIMKLLESKWNKYVAVLLPSFLFSLSHVPAMETISLWGVLLLILSGTLVGIMFSLIAYKGKSISNNILLHVEFYFGNRYFTYHYNTRCLWHTYFFHNNTCGQYITDRGRIWCGSFCCCNNRIFTYLLFNPFLEKEMK